MTRWGRGELMFHPEDSAEALYMLLQGAVRLYRLGANAREVTLDVHGPGALLGWSSLLPSGQHDMYAEAMDDLEVLVLGKEAFTRLLQVAPAVGVAFIEQITQQTRTVQERLAGLVFLDVSQRLALALLTIGEREGEWSDSGTLALRERVSHQDLAHVVGSTRETITKLLGDFRNRGLLDLGYRRIILTDRDGLLEASRESMR